MDLESWAAHVIAKLAAKWAATSTTELVWIGVGFGAQCMFFMRFVIQWLASEKAKKSVMPDAFWFDVRFTASRVSGIPPWTQMVTLANNFTALFARIGGYSLG